MSDRAAGPDQLTPAQLDRLVRSLLAKTGGAAAPPPIPRADHGGGELPLSFPQRRLWFLAQLDPAAASYHIAGAVQLRGPLCRAALAASLAAVVRRHDALRTVFLVAGGEPVQRVLPAAAAPPPLPVVDLAGLPGAVREREAGRLGAAVAGRAFDLAHLPLLRTVLLALAPAEHRLLIVLHHIVSDGWSNRLLLAEVSRRYGPLAAGRPPALPELPLQYPDFALWQRRHFSGEEAERHLAYFRRRLGGPLPALDLPGDRPRPAVRGSRGGLRRRRLSPALGDALAALAGTSGATLFMTLLAAFAALLARHAGQEELAIGLPVANRGRAELAELIGCFVNTLVVTVDLAGDPPFSRLLARVRDELLAAEEHAELPFECLVEALEPRRDLSRNPLFDAMLAVEEEPLAMTLPGLEAVVSELHAAAAQLDLTLVVARTGGGFSASFEYSRDLFDPATVERLLGHFESLLGAVAAAPERPLSALPLLSAAETAQLRREWQGGAPLASPLAAAAGQDGGRPAIACGESLWSYDDLARFVRRQGRRLRALGVGPEVRVGVLLERSPELPAALLAVLAAGGAYLPLDPELPAARLTHMLRDAGARLLLTRQSLAARLAPPALPVICLEEAVPETAPEAAVAPAGPLLPVPVASPEQLAYVLYTSGSTGAPKGVEVSHRALFAQARAAVAEYGLTAGDRVLQFAAPGFDVAAEEIFSTWLAGGCLVLPDRPPAELLPDLGGWIERHGVSVVNLPAAAWQEWVGVLARTSGAGLPSSLRLAIAGSEAAATARLADWSALAAARAAAGAAGPAGPALRNAYGVTEATITSTVYRPAPPAPAGRSLPIGRPLAGVSAHVLDRHGLPVPAGVVGELHLGGHSLARGYVGLPALTASAFVPDPFAEAPGSRLYRTGDLVRWLPDGNLEHLGRRDRQVKIRGQRIEPGEIEAVLATHPRVRQAAVVLVAGGAGGPAAAGRLVAYVAADPGAAPSAKELRTLLRERLAEAMVPALFVMLPALPLTASGKLDRAALPAPAAVSRLAGLAGLAGHAGSGGAGAAAGAAPDLPLTSFEEVIAGIWAEALGRDRVGREEDFFDLGGHSLLVTTVLARIHQLLAVELPPRALFEAPTVAALAARVAAARQESAAIAAEPAPPLAPLPRRGDIPLSFGQERLWVLEQLDLGHSAHRIAAALRCRGPLDPAVLTRCLQEVTRRHESLRTTFAAAGGAPAQRVAAAPLGPVLARADLRRLAAATRRRELERLLAGGASRPFDLGRGPLWRVLLLALAADEHLLFFDLHHIITDGWSMGLLVEETAALYGAFAAGEPSPLPELPLQYPDFAVWQRRWLTGQALASRLAYWRERLRGSPPLLELPTDRPRPAARRFTGARVESLLPEPLVAALARLGRGHGATLFMTLLAGFAALLAQLSGQLDLALGTFIANRTRAEIQRLIGFFVNNLVLRLELDPELGFAGGAAPSRRGLLELAREVTLGAYLYQDLPFERLLDEVKPPRTAQHAPLFQVMLVLQNAPSPSFVLPGLELTGEPLPRAHSDFDLTLWVEPAGAFGMAGHRAALEYSTELFDAATARRLLGHLTALLAAAAAEPGRRLGELAILGDAERHQLLHAWNDTRPAGLDPAPVEQRFAALAAAAPDRLAVVAAGGRGALSYGELERRANRLAGVLSRRLGGRGAPIVALCLERSPDLVVAMLAALKAGAAYLPLEPGDPPERLRDLLADAGAALVLCEERHAERLAGASAPLLPLLAAAREAAAGAGPPPPAAGLAYVIYTSGSTGTPKGVAVSRAALAGFTADSRLAYALAPGDRLLQFVAVNFDAAVEEIYPTLTSGATLVLRDDAMLLSAASFLARCRDLGLSVLDLPTAHWRQLALAVFAGEPLPAALRLVILGGESAPADVVREWLARCGRVRLVNTYGPTEATVVATRAELVAGDGWHEPPLGRPLAGVTAYVLNRELLPQPIGGFGELFLGGAGIARGYLGAAAATAERFLPDPWSGDPGARLYRTGDLVRLLGDGRLEFRGRVDQQVKIRGYRVEPVEVQAAIERHPEVRECAVVARSEGAGGPLQLIAYLVPAAGAAPPSTAALRRYLRGSLPDFMLPAQVVALDRLPLTARGKLDVRALPAPAGMRGDLAAGYLAPRDAVEELLAGIWCELLGLDRVGVEDNFFDLGGHSLLATQVAARAREALGVELPLISLFEAPTIAALAALVRQSEESRLPPPEPVARDRPLPLSYAQERLWFLNRLDPESTAYHVPRALRIEGRLDAAALAGAFIALVARHEVLRTSFPEVDGRPVQVIHPPPVAGRESVMTPVLRQIDLAALGEARRQRELSRLILEQGNLRFDLARGPLLRVLLVRLGDQEHALLQVEHHLVHDGWTSGVLVGDLLALYEAARLGRPSPLPELPIQYADFAAWQRRWLEGEPLARQLAYWTEQLRGAPALVSLPADRPRPAARAGRGALLHVPLPRRLIAACRALCRREQATLFMAMQAAFDALCSRWNGELDMVTGTGLANRRLRESEGMLGMVINTLVLRVDLAGDPPFSRLLERVRRVCMGAYAHQDLPFDRLVAALKLERHAGSNPLFQLVFAFNDPPEPAPELPGLRVTSLDAHNLSAKFDVNLLIAPATAGAAGRGGAAADDLVALLEYDTALFDPPTVRRLLVHFEVLLAAAAAAPETRLAALPLLAAAELAQLRTEWNDTAAAYPAAAAVPALFAGWAARQPEAVALSYPDGEITYGELAGQARRLARRLARLGTGRGDRVAFCLHRSAALPAVLLGVLEAGAAYVPLDPGYPRERLRWLLADTGARVVVTTAELAPLLPEGSPPTVLLDRDPAVLLDRNSTPRGAAAPPPPPPGGMPARTAALTGDDLAYVLYTSGSTGRPKGTAVPHRAILRLVLGTDYVRLGPDDRVAQAATATFDAATFEIWGALLNGAAVVGVAKEVALTPATLAAELAARAVTTLFLTTALFDQIALAAPGAFAPLAQLLFGGELANPDRVRAVLAAGAPGRLLHVYGPTENTTFTSWTAVAPPAPGAASVPIGRPLANTRIHLLDPQLAPVPIGVPVELYAAGDGVAQGYWQSPGATAAAFLPDPWSGEPGARMYRTGDRVRLLPDGRVDFLGRLDHQVKIRGFRIEPGEVEAVLAAHPAVGRAAVVVREEAPGDRRLVAYVVPRAAAAAAAAGGAETAAAGDDLAALLLGHLRERLPEYLIPWRLMALDALPLTASGKLDRRALPDPDFPAAGAAGAAGANGGAAETPETPTEREVAAVWREVLSRPRIGRDENFFELGGHSLLATQVVSRLAGRFRVPLPLRSVFDHPTISGVARLVDDLVLEAARPERLELLLGEMDSLSEAEIEALLDGGPSQGGAGLD